MIYIFSHASTTHLCEKSKPPLLKLNRNSTKDVNTIVRGALATRLKPRNRKFHNRLAKFSSNVFISIVHCQNIACWRHYIEGTELSLNRKKFGDLSALNEFNTWLGCRIPTRCRKSFSILFQHLFNAEWTNFNIITYRQFFQNFIHGTRCKKT